MSGGPVARRAAVIVFPGSNGDRDLAEALSAAEVAGHSLGGMEAQNLVADRRFRQRYTPLAVVTCTTSPISASSRSATPFPSIMLLLTFRRSSASPVVT